MNRFSEKLTGISQNSHNLTNFKQIKLISSLGSVVWPITQPCRGCNPGSNPGQGGFLFGGSN